MKSRVSSSSFVRQTIHVLVRIHKVAGTLEYIAECVQSNRPIPGELIDEYYHRMWRLEDSMNELRRTSQWQHADVCDDLEDDEVEAPPSQEP